MLSGRRSPDQSGPRPSGACGEELEPSGLAMTEKRRFMQSRGAPLISPPVPTCRDWTLPIEDVNRAFIPENSDSICRSGFPTRPSHTGRFGNLPYRGQSLFWGHRLLSEGGGRASSSRPISNSISLVCSPGTGVLNTLVGVSLK